MKLFLVSICYFFFTEFAIAQTLDLGDFNHPCKKVRTDASTLKVFERQKSGKDFSQEKQQISFRKALDQDCLWTPTFALDRNDFNGIGLSDGRSTFLTTRLGISYRKRQNSGDFYQIQAGSAYRFEAQSGANVFIPAGFGIWSHKTDNYRWFYGGGVSDIFGNTTAFPILGVHKRWNEKWSTRLLLPFIVNTTYRFSREELLSIMASPMSFQAELANDGRFNSSKSTLQARFRAYRLGIGLRKKLKRQFSLRVQAGLLLGRRYQIYDNHSRVYEERVKGTPYGELAVNWNF
jgi:hypothetical protein